MKKLIYLLSFFSCIVLHAHDDAQNPTLEEIFTSKIVELSIKCLPEGNDFNVQAWQEIIINVNDLINTCYASDDGKVTDDDIFAEIHKTIDFIRERTDLDEGLHGIIEIHLGQPPKASLQQGNCTEQPPC